MDRDTYGALDRPDANGRLHPLPRTASETGFVATANDATAAAVPPDVAGQFWKREHSREIKFGRGGIVSIIERAGPPDEELTVGRRVAITEFSVEFVDVQFAESVWSSHDDQLFFRPDAAGPAWHRPEQRSHEANADVDGRSSPDIAGPS